MFDYRLCLDHFIYPPKLPGYNGCAQNHHATQAKTWRLSSCFGRGVLGLPGDDPRLSRSFGREAGYYLKVPAGEVISTMKVSGLSQMIR